MKKMLRFAPAVFSALCLLLILSFLPSEAEGFILPVDEPETLSERYIPLYDSDDFLKIAENPAGEFLMMNDISLSDDAAHALSGINFQGNFDGNGHTVSINKTVRAEKNGEYGGLFKAVTGGYVQNVKLTGTLRLIPSSRIVTCCIGGIAGTLSGDGFIHNVVSNVAITKEDSRKFEKGGTGGVVDAVKAQVSDILRSDEEANVYNRLHAAFENTVYGVIDNWHESGLYVTAIVSCLNNGKVQGCRNVGGIVGLQDKESFCLVIVNCLNIPDIRCGYDGGTTCAAGILGKGHAYIGVSVSIGFGKGNPSACAAHGYGYAPYIFTIEDFYFKAPGVLKGMDENGKVLRETDGQIAEDCLNRKDSYPGLDFDAEWVLEEGMDYPYPRALYTEYT